jgi:cytochrome c-type biogenesis protein CcmH
LRRLPAAEQAKAIEGMVEGLAARLGKDGSDLAGWLRLVRAYKVMGRDEAAVAALARARQAMAGNGSALAELEQLARTLGIGG